MTANDERAEFEVRVGRLRLKKGDMLIVKCDKVLPVETQQKLAHLVAKKLPEGTDFFIVGPDINFDILTFDQLIERKKTA